MSEDADNWEAGTWEMVIDGASRGNPGRAAAGVIIVHPAGFVCFQEGRPLGTTTNNQAEYHALLIGLREALRLNARRLRVWSDSELLVQQMRGAYRVRNPALKDLHAEANRLVREFESVEICWTPRWNTSEADALARSVLREKKKRTSPSPRGKAAPPATSTTGRKRPEKSPGASRTGKRNGKRTGQDPPPGGKPRGESP